MRCLPFLSGLGFALGILALFLVTPAWAEEPTAIFEAIKRASLQGIESVEVIVVATEAEVRCPDLPDAQVRTDVEDRLQRAGIQIGPGSKAYLFVSVVSVPALEDVFYAFAVSVDLQQLVRLSRDMRILTFGTTWHLAGLGVASSSKMPEYPRQLLADIVDRFINDHLEQNPKQ